MWLLLLFLILWGCAMVSFRRLNPGTWAQIRKVAAASVTPPVDETPDAFAFTAVTGAALSTEQTSNTITVSGLGSGVSVAASVSGGTYSKNGGAYVSSVGTATNGDTFAVRHTSSASNSAIVNTTLTLGSVSAGFVSTTLAAVVDTTPDAFGFTDATSVALSSTQTSNTITVAGINAPATVTITGGTYSKNGGGYVSTAGTAQNGDTFAVQHTASASNSTATNTVLTIGGVSDTFTSTTLAEVVVPGTFPTTVNTSLPMFAISPETTTNPTTFALLDMESLIAGDTMWIEAATDDGFTVDLTRHYHTLTDAELNTGPPYNLAFTPALSTLTGGTRRYRPTTQRGAERSSYGTTQRVGPNDVAPVLSALSVSDITFTTANINVTTNYTPGTLYFLHTATNVAPSTAAMLAGTAQAVTSAGAKVQSVTGTSGDLRYAWVMHRPDAGPDSAITTAGPIQFAVPVVSSAWDPTGLSSDLTLFDGNREARMTTAAGPRTVLGVQARSSGKYWVEIYTDKNGGGGKPGIRDEAANKTVSFGDDSSAGDAGGGWGLTWNTGQTSTIRFEVDFTTSQIQAFLNGTSAGTKAFPSGATSFKPWAEIVSVVGSKSIINTGQATPMGTVTSGFSPWG